MKILLLKEPAGTFTVVIEKTKPSEGPTVVTRGVPGPDVASVVDEVVPVLKNGGVRPEPV